MSNNPEFPNATQLSEDARKSVRNAFDALEQWRQDMRSANDRYSDRVFDEMGRAAKHMGWPDEMVDATRDHLNQATSMQMEMIDGVMKAWKNQIESSDAAMGVPQNMMNPMKAFQPGQMGGMSMKDMGNLGAMPLAPFQFWMQAAEMWQRNMMTAMSMWTGGANNFTDMFDPNKRGK